VPELLADAHYCYVTWVLCASAAGNDALKMCAVCHRRLSSWSALGLLQLLTLATTARENKMADFIATFMKNSASKMQLMYLVTFLCPDQLEALTTQLQNLYSGKK